MKLKSKHLILSILAIVSLLVITSAITYAFFNYTKEGTNENSITTGTITFLYTEVEANGAGISIKDALPMDDATGKTQTGAGNVFNFTVQANTQGKAAINYEVTARKKDTSTLDENAVKLYLTEVSGDTEKELLLDTYDKLTPTTVEVPENKVEKIIYTGKVTSNTSNYQKDFRLRMWVDSSIDYSGGDYNGKEFTVTINVYANAKVVTQDEIDLENTALINSININSETAMISENEEYDYELNVENEVTEASIQVETINPNAIVEVEKIDSLAYVSPSIKRLSNIKTITFNLNEGNNYFKVTVISENKQVEKEYFLNIYRKPYSYEAIYEEIDATATTQNKICTQSGTYQYGFTSSGYQYYCCSCDTNPSPATCPGGITTGSCTCSNVCGTTTVYSCNDGYILNGTKCYRYTCPNGGTLEGTTCFN